MSTKPALDLVADVCTGGPRAVVRMQMSERDALEIGERIRQKRDDAAQCLRDQLWLLSVLIEQRRRTNLAEREQFDARADRILERLDP